MALKTKSIKQTKVKFNDDHSSKTNGMTNKSAGKNKHIKFDDDVNETEVTATSTEQEPIAVDKKQKALKKIEKNRKNALEIGKLWYQTYAKHNTSGELVEMKNHEIEELTNYCGKCYEELKPLFQKRNPSDVKWLQTALHKGTSKDRANAGGLLVQSNPLANLETLESLISFTKVTNKNSTDSVEVATDLFINALLPPNRKLISFALRGGDWKALKKDDTLDKATKDQIYAYWHFETVIKDQYFEFLRNVQNAIQSGQEANKKQGIICASKLLSYAPEKEQMLLSMLVNKLGDPSKLIASKALHHLTEVSFKHPAMCGVIANETEKFLFRNNITEHAQHFALCFLSQLAPNGNVEVCTKLVNICLSFFKVVVNKGLINSKIMQAILLCLKHSITDVVKSNKTKPDSDSGLLSKDTQDTIYRLVHFANIKISLQTLALILQMITAMGAEHQHNRFYNALYKKLLDPELGSCGSKYSALFLHIVHRAIHVDRNKSRAQAFIKRLFQVAMFLPAQITCGCLIIISKILKARSELNRIDVPVTVVPKTEDKPENENDATEEETKLKTNKYDPYHRSPEFAGAEYAIRTELTALLQHYHPTVRVFAQNILEDKAIKFYGDPLIDFSLTRFLDRFAFKNPKKDSENKQELVVQTFHHKHYTPYGSRGKPVKQLSAANCTEDEKFIFAYLDKKRERLAAAGLTGQKERFESVDDDEFDAYLDSLGGKKGKDDGLDDDDDFDIAGAFGDGKSGAEGDDEDWDSHGDDEDDDDENDNASVGKHKMDVDDEFDDSDVGSISLDEDDENEDGDSDLFESEDEEEEFDSDNKVSDPEDEPQAKRMKSFNNKDFQKKLKSTTNMNSLFAAAEDFSEMLEETGKSSEHGTLGEIFNKDKSSEKQLAWESKRLKKSNNFNRKSKQKRNRSQGKKRRGEMMNRKSHIGGKRKYK